MEDNGSILLKYDLLLLVVIGLIICSAYPTFKASGADADADADAGGGGVVVLSKGKGKGKGKGMCIETEKQALLHFKHGLNDTHNYLSSWGGEEDDCCLWKGVGCHNQTGNVIHLDLGRCLVSDDSFCFSGKISNSLLKLQFLRHLDLSGYNFFKNIPNYIDSFSNLRYLNLSYIDYPPNTEVPVEISNLSRLHTLDLGCGNGLQSNKLGWLSRSYSLRYLDLSGVDLSRATDWLHTVSMLPSLTTLKMRGCDIPPPKILPVPLSHANISNSLTYLDFSFNQLNYSSIHHWFPNITRNAIYLDFCANDFSGSILQHLWAITSLKHLDLFGNRLEGEIPIQFGNLISLEYLDLSHNSLEGRIPNQLGNLTSLQYLDLSNNNLQGVVPQLGMLPNLRRLDLTGNNLTGIIVPGFLQDSLLSLQELYLGHNRLDSTSSLMESIGRFSNLNALDISNNPSKSVISQAHLNNLSALQFLFLSNLPLDISLDWVPPFQLQALEIGSCNLGPHFPEWLQTQNELQVLNLSRNGISSIIPDWFWNTFDTSSFQLLDLSFNQLLGTLPNIPPLNSSYLSGVDLSSNNLSGPMPQHLLNVEVLDLSNNLFSGSFLCTILFKNVWFLNLSNNSLSGELPDCWSRFIGIEYLNLANNRFSGNIPKSMGSLLQLSELYLRKNMLSGELPSSLRNCTELKVLDVMENKLSGNIPLWIGSGNLQQLQILSLRSNMLHGDIPSSICNLQSIQTLDLSLNNLSGGIPGCFDNFTTLSSKSGLSIIYPFEFSSTFIFQSYSELVQLKGIEREYKNRLGLIKLIDLSCNNLTGGIPHQVTNLVYLISLNLSRNYLTGGIPTRIGNLSSLDTLDLSNNQLSGQIPSGLSALSHLGTLNLSCNNLSGRIPLGTQLQGFDPSVYQGNSRLCGPPLAACHEAGRMSDLPPDNRNGDQDTDHDDDLLSLPFYIGAILGFIVGFWGVFGSLVLKRSWRTAYFQWLSRVTDNMYVKIVVSMGRVKRRFHR